MRYVAFISYASADREFAQRFQRAIEWYRVPKAFRGKRYGFGEVPTYLAPLFRDRSDIDSNRSLGAELQKKLEASDALIVVCSPAAALSSWVNKEIRAFKALGRDDRIFPVVVAGLPMRFDAESAPDGALPPALFERYDAQGALIGSDETEPLVPDARDEGDGLEGAKLKVMAALTGIPLTEFKARDQEATRAARRVRQGVTAALAVLAVAASTAAILAWRQSIYAGERLDDAIKTAARRIDDAANMQDQYGVPTKVIASVLSRAEDNFKTLIEAGASSTPMLMLEAASLKRHFAAGYGKIGNAKRQRELCEEALTALDKVPTQGSVLAPSTWFVRVPSKGDVLNERLAVWEIQGMAQVLEKDGATRAINTFKMAREAAARAGDGVKEGRFWSLTGLVQYLLGNLNQAVGSYDTALRMVEAAAAKSAVAKDAEVAADAQHELATISSDKAEMLLETGQLAPALALQQEATKAFEALAKEKAAKGENDTLLELQVAQSLVRQGDMRYAVSGSWTEALKDVERGIAIFDRLYAADAERIDIANDLAKGLDREGDAHLQMANTKACLAPALQRTGELDLNVNEVARARTVFDRTFEIRKKMHDQDRSNEEWARNYRVSLERLSEVASAERRPKDALAHLTEAQNLLTCRSSDGRVAVEEVRVALTRSEEDLGCYHDASILLNKSAVARWRAAEGDWEKEFKGAIALLTVLTSSDQAVPGWTRDLYVFHFTYGDALMVARRNGEARVAYAAAKSLMEAYAEAEPIGALTRQDAACLDERLASAHAGQAKRGNAPRTNRARGKRRER